MSSSSPLGSARARVAIVGVGARTPVGLAAFSSTAAAAAGISRIVEHPFMVDKSGDPFNVAMDQTLDVADRRQRIDVLAHGAIDQAMALWHANPAHTLPVYLALPELGPHFLESDVRVAADRVAVHLRDRCRATVFPIPRGNAAGALALWRAASVIRERQASAALVVGVDSYLDPHVLEGLDAAGRVASSTNRWGFPPGEGAGALLVVDSSTAKTLGVAPLAQVQAVGLAEERSLIATDDVCVGVGLAEAMRLAVDEAGGEPAQAVYCDINGERYRASEYAYAALRLRPGVLAEPSRFTTAADAWGEVGAATIPLLILLASWTGRRGRAPGPRAMVFAGSESGLRGAVIVDVPPAEVFP